MNACNIPFAEVQGKESNIAIVIKKLQRKNASAEEIGEQFKKLKIKISSGDKDSTRNFIQMVQGILENYFRKGGQEFSKDELDFRENILRAVFDEQDPSKLILEYLEDTNAGLPDSERQAQREEKLEDVLVEIFGRVNCTTLSKNLQETFTRELINELIYDSNKFEPHNYGKFEVNSKISEYKQRKFKNILNFLRSVEPNNAVLESIDNLYDQFGFFNPNSYHVLINEFQKYLQDQVNLGDNLVKEIHNREALDKQISSYNTLVKKIKQDGSPFKEWFNKTFKSPWDRNHAETDLFTLNHYSRYFNLIQAKINTTIEENPNEDYSEYKELIDEITKPTKQLLSAVDDFISLTYFDDLLGVCMSEYVSFDEKSYTKNSMPSTTIMAKYSVNQSKKHQNSGYETYDKESSEAHTSTVVKEIIATIPIYRYDDPNATPTKHIELNQLIQSWQALLQDILSDNLNFRGASTDGINEAKKELKRLVNSLGEDVLKNTHEILRILFTKGGIPGMQDIPVFRLVKSSSFSEEQKNILYSFFETVLNQDNANSILSTEMATFKAKGGEEITPVTANITAVLFRNVDNRYLQCKLSGKDKSFKIRSKFNWSSEFFDTVERCSFASKLKQAGKIDVQTGLDTYKVSVESLGDGVFSISILLDLNNENSKITFISANGIGKFFTGFNLDEASAQVLKEFANIKDFRSFKRKVLSGNIDAMEPSEFLLYRALGFIDNYLKLGTLTELGLDALETYKDNYTSWHTDAGITSANYLEHFLGLAARTASIDYEINLAQNAGIPFSDYLKNSENGSIYNNLYQAEIRKSYSNSISIEGSRAYLLPVSRNDKVLEEYSKYIVVAKGKSARATSRNELGSSVPNYSISRLGSELNRRLAEQASAPEGSAVSTLLFAQHPELIDTNPVIDQTVITFLGEAKEVKDLTTGELFQHAIFDKFFKSYIDTKKICFQPTVYSDKTQFLNYMASLDIFKTPDGKSIMDLTRTDVAELCKTEYQRTFFQAHKQMLENIQRKFGVLIEFSEGISKNYYSIAEVKTFLRKHTYTEIKQIVDSYNSTHPDTPIELELDKDYRERTDTFGNKFCDVNEIIEFYARLAKEENLAELNTYFDRQIAVFVDNLKDYGINLNLFNSAEEITAWTKKDSKKEEEELEKYPNYLLTILSDKNLLARNSRQAFVDKWVNKNTGDLKIQDEDGNLNPILERFFYIEGLYSNNLRLSLTGSEVNHPDKDAGNPYRRVIDIIAKINKSTNPGERAGHVSELKKLGQSLGLFSVGVENSIIENFINEINTARSLNDLYFSGNEYAKKLYDMSIISIINTAEGTQFKRNVIVPATLQHPVIGKIDGVAPEAIVAVVRDTKAPVNTLRESDKIDSQDGSAQMSPIAVRQENLSLGDQKVGISRKPIWDAQTSDCTSFLAKFAAYSSTNETMRKTLGATSGLYKQFKKMHHIRWNGTIDLTHSILNFASTPISDVNAWFRNTILEHKGLYYKNAKGDVIAIMGFGKDGDAYYTEECLQKELGLPNPTITKVKHYFNNNGDHFTTPSEGLHTIDSLFELYKALGDLNCCDIDGNPSEFNLDVLTNFVNNVGYRKVQLDSSGKKIPIKWASDVVQPLKSKFISYVFNNTAVKNGAKNINSASAWEDDTPLSTFKLSYKGLGIQLNADHDVDSGELTEFSQVIAACAAYGKTYDSINEIYTGLAESAFEASKDELENIKKFINNTKNRETSKYKLYKIIGKYILSKKSTSDLDLTEQLKRDIAQEFKINKDGTSSELRIPFSDPTMYSQFISSITSTINKKSIKRKHPGSGYVMAPSYDIIQYYQVWNGKEYRQYMSDDILELAQNEYKNGLIKAIQIWNRINGQPEDFVKFKLFSKFNFKSSASISQLEQIIAENNIDINSLVSEDITEQNLLKQAQIGIAIDTQDIQKYQSILITNYLKNKQAEEVERPASWFMPTDHVLVNYSDGTSITLDLSDISNYYKFKDGILDVEEHYNVSIKKQNNGNIRISLSDKPNEELKLENLGDNAYNIYVNTTELTPEEENRLTDAMLDILPMGAKVNYLDESGNLIKTQILEKAVSKTYKLSVTSPCNLKPSLIRWQYVDDNGQTQFMTIYDHPIIKDGWKGKKHTQAEIQKVLDDLENGVFYIPGKEKAYKVIEGTLENTEAELVMGNMYKGLFGIENESLAHILDKGEDYFREKMEGKMTPKLPTGYYDFAFTKDNGNHTLISVGTISNGINSIKEYNFKPEDETIDDETGEVHWHNIKIAKYIKAPSSWKINYDEGGAILNVLDENNNRVDPSKYRIINVNSGAPTIEQRVDFVKRYTLEKVEQVNNLTQTHKYTLYKIADVEDIRKALNNVDKNGKVLSEDEMKDSAFRQISKILDDLYNAGSYTDVMVNSNIRTGNEDENKYRLDNVQTRNYLYGCIGNAFVPMYIKDPKTGVVRERTGEEIKNLSLFEQHILKVKEALGPYTRNKETGKLEMLSKEEATNKDYWAQYASEVARYHTSRQNFHKKWVSFQNSLHFISSRIPAQSLQSFMPMKCVGWVNGTSNIAYVSYIQTYLQGSDYDIDKAYIMGQSFDDDGIFIGWSNLFNYSDETSLAASKTLPLPRRTVLKSSTNNIYDITAELSDIIIASEANKTASKIRAYAKLIRKIDQNQGNYWIDRSQLKNKDIIDSILHKVESHELYKIPYDAREAAYKNVASSNIYNVVHNIRNRDQAYSPITMRDLQDIAKDSPKGTKTKALNTINPLTKYVMQNQNITGKNVIGIAANGEKDWFNLTYYYHNLLRTGDESDLFFLKMSHSYKRLMNRSKGVPITYTVKHIPDLWNADGVINRDELNSRLAQRIKQVFYDNNEFKEAILDDRGVDQLISQLLSAATDNAKELILSKINAGTNLAKYYIHMMIMGFSLDDIASFMTSPVVELIDKYSKSDFYSYTTGSVNGAIAILQGKLPLSKFLVPPSDSKHRLTQEELEEQMNALEEQAAMEQDLLEQGIIPPAPTQYTWVIKEIQEIYNVSKAENLQEFIQKYITAKTTPNSEDEVLQSLAEYTLPTDTGNINTNKFFKYVNDLVDNINREIAEYNKHRKSDTIPFYDLQAFSEDLEEFRVLTDEANETSTLASVWLKLNQGIPQTDTDIIKRLKNMQSTVTVREGKFGIARLKPSNRESFNFLEDGNEFDVSETKKELLEKYLEVIKKVSEAKTPIKEALTTLTANKDLKKYANTILTIMENNSMLSYDEVTHILIDAIDAEIYGNFDIYKYLNDDPVRLTTRDVTAEFIDGVNIPISTYQAYKGKTTYREVAARYYNLIKSSWNVLDIMRKIPHYEKNLDLFNYTLQSRRTFSAKAKLIDKFMGIDELKYLSLSDKQYKNITRFVDRVINTHFFFTLKQPISLSKYIEDMGNLPKVYTPQYELVTSDTLDLSTLQGIDSLKHFVENEFLVFLKKNYPNNALIQDLDIMPYNEKSSLRTRLNLDDIDASLVNQQTYSQYLIAIQQLAQEDFASVIDENGETIKYSIADILALYNLAVNGTTVSGKNLTGIFRDSVNPGSALRKYYQYIGNLDYEETLDGKIFPSKTDFLIAIAPEVYSQNAVKYRTEPYVKVKDPTRGYIIMQRYYNKPTKEFKYKEVNIGLEFLSLPNDENLDERLYEYYTNSLSIFPQLHKKMADADIFEQASAEKYSDLTRILKNYIRCNKLAILIEC